jgi:hypothetical protein
MDTATEKRVDGLEEVKLRALAISLERLCSDFPSAARWVISLNEHNVPAEPDGVDVTFWQRDLSERLGRLLCEAEAIAFVLRRFLDGER